MSLRSLLKTVKRHENSTLSDITPGAFCKQKQPFLCCQSAALMSVLNARACKYLPCVNVKRLHGSFKKTTGCKKPRLLPANSQ